MSDSFNGLAEAIERYKNIDRETVIIENNKFCLELNNESEKDRLIQTLEAINWGQGGDIQIISFDEMRNYTQNEIIASMQDHSDFLDESPFNEVSEGTVFLDIFIKEPPNIFSPCFIIRRNDWVVSSVYGEKTVVYFSDKKIVVSIFMI